MPPTRASSCVMGPGGLCKRCYAFKASSTGIFGRPHNRLFHSTMNMNIMIILIPSLPSPSLYRELTALETRLTTLGYQDGVDDGVEEVVQKGFDKGYAAGAAAGWQTGTLYGGAAAAAAAVSQAATVKRDRRGPVAASRADTSGAERTLTSVVDSEEGGSAAFAAGHSYRGGPSRGGVAVEQTAAAPGELAILVEELRRASVFGPDDPRVDQADVVGRLRLAGSPIAAVADALGD